MIRAFGGFFFLLWHELRLTLRGGSTHDPQRKGRRILIGGGAAILLGIGYFLADILRNVSPSYETPVLIVVSLFIASLTTLMLGHALIAVTDSVYTRGDLDLLLSSPFSPWTVLLVRTIGVAARVGGTYFILLSAVGVWLIVFGALQWLSPLAGLIGLALLCTAAGILLAMLLFLTIGPRSTRIVAQLIAALVGASIFLAFQLQNLDSPEQRGQRWEATARYLFELDVPASHPLLLPARAFLGEPTALLLWTGGALTIFLLATLWFSGRFVRDAAAILAVGTKRKAARRGVRRTRGGVTLTVIRKELRLIGRDPVLLSHILLQLVYLAPLGIALANGALRTGIASGFFLGFMAGAIAAIGASIVSALAWIIISAEDAPDLIAAAPVGAGPVERGKVLAAAAPVILIGAAAGVLMSFVSMPAAIWTFVGVTIAAVSAAMVGLWHQQPGSRKNFRRRPRASWSAQLGQGFVSTAWSAATGFAAGGWEPLAIIPALIAIGLLLALHESRRTDGAAAPAQGSSSTSQ